MKRIYWRPRRVSRSVLGLIAVLAVLGLSAVELFQVRRQQRWYGEKMVAARVAREAMEVIRQERLKRRPAIDFEADPTGSGLIGRLMSPITTNVGHLPSKQTTVNPNFAAVAVHLLRRAGVQEGDVVAVGTSGSFPAVNLAVMAAMEALKLEPIVISSLTGSQWGANDPHFTWLDMERALWDRRIISHRTVAASPGGIEDRALGLTKDARDLVYAAIQRAEVDLIKPRNYVESVERRWEIYREKAGDRAIVAYVNVGGGTASVGTRAGKQLFKPGLNRVVPPGSTAFDSLMTRFVKDGVPVVHFVKMHQLAARYGLPVVVDAVPAVGEGRVFYSEEYSVPLTCCVLAAILLALYAFVRSDVGFRLLQTRRSASHEGPPEQMV